MNAGAMLTRLGLLCFCILGHCKTVVPASVAVKDAGTKPCANKAADIVFALDTSSSIWEEDFTRQLKFVENLIDTFPVSESGVHVGVITYGTVVFHQFSLNAYFAKNELITAIDVIPYVGGGTNTGDAIKHAREKLFPVNNGGRKHVSKILVVITDGYSTNETLTAWEASIARSHGIAVFAIGVGNGVDGRELRAIATKPTTPADRFVYRVDDFGTMEEIQADLSAHVCKAMNVEQMQADQPLPDIAPTADARKYCGGKPADVYFVIDASSSIWEPNFRKMLDFVNSVIDTFDIGPDQTRVGVVAFSDGIHPMVAIDNPYPKDLLQRRIKSIPFLKGGTRTGSAIQYIRERGFAPGHARRSVAHVAIIITDGQSADTTKTIRQAKMAHKEGIYIFAIGIGNQTDTSELRQMASQPEENFVFQMQTYDALDSIKNILAIKTCASTAKEIQNDDAGCKLETAMDIMYVYDTYTLGRARSERILQAIHDTIVLSNRSNGTMRSGVLRGTCTKIRDIPLSRHIDRGAFLTRTTTRKSTGVTGLLRKARVTSFREVSGGRYAAKNVVVLFIDNRVQDYHEVAMEAKRVTFKNRIELYVVVLGDRGNEKDVGVLCTKPVDEHLLVVSSYSELESLPGQLMAKLCH